MTRKKFTSKFKTKVVLVALKERMSSQELAKKFDIHPQQISTWKREFLRGAEEVFSKGRIKGAKTEQKQKEDQLLRMIGQQKVDIDFLKTPCVNTVNRKTRNDKQGSFQIEYCKTM